MITRVTISNYKSLGEDVVLELGRLTALVGPNSSGKSNVADALMFVSDALRLGLNTAVTERLGFEAIRRGGTEKEKDVSIRLEGDWGYYEFTLSPKEESGDYFVSRETLDDALSDMVWVRHRDDDDHLNNLVEGRGWAISHVLDPRALGLGISSFGGEASSITQQVRSIAIYSILPDYLRKPQEINKAWPMRERGENWATVLRRADQDRWKNDLLAALVRVTGDIDDFRVKEIDPWLIPEFHHSASDTRGDEGRWASAALESDGTLRIAGILAALYQSPTPALIGIEEPELSVHPGMLRLLYDFLNEASTRGQVLVTTHSPELLAQFRADDVRVVERREGVTTVGRLAEPQRKVVEDRLLTLGELMLSEPLEQAPATAGGT